MSAETKRFEYIDALRAMAMLFVIYGHLVDGWTEYFVFTSPIKIPLFFAISGYLFNDKRNSTKAFFRNLVIKLVIPWLCLSILPVAFISLFKGADYLIEHIVMILTGEDIWWYMPCCIIAEIIHFFVRKAFKSEKYIIAASLVISAAGLILADNDILSICMVNRAMTVQLFMLIGFMLKKHPVGSLKNSSMIAVACAYLILGVLSIFLFPGKSMDIHMNVYYSIPICLAMIVLGMVLVFGITQRINRFPKWLTFIGQNTLVYYLWHIYILRAVEGVMNRLGISVPESYAFSVVTMIVICVGCAVCSLIINRFAPWTARKRRNS